MLIRYDILIYMKSFQICNQKRKRFGFSIMEILIVLLIMAVIAGAIVPLLNPSKTKRQNDNITSNHGAAECFYDEDGGLYLWTIDNKDNKSGTLEKMTGNSCSISLPKANFYKMTAIGAGGSVNANYGDVSYSPTTQTQKGQIRVDTNFQEDMKKAPEAIRKLWDKNARYAYYRIKSPMRPGGSGLKYYVQNNIYAECVECTIYNSSTCPSSCYQEECAKGGNSGKGLNMTVKIPLKSSDTVSFVNNTSESKVLVGSDKYITLYASGYGRDAYDYYNSYLDGTNGADASYELNGVSISDKNDLPSREGEQCGPIDNYLTELGSISVTGFQDYEYEYSLLAANLDYYTKGGLGEMSSVVYEKLSNKNLILTPAKNNEYGNNISKIEIHDDGGNKTILQAASGINGSLKNKIELIQTDSDLPLPQSIIDDIKVEYPSNYLVSTGFKSKIKDLTPGKAGYGAYPLINTLGEGVTNTIKLKVDYNSWVTEYGSIDTVVSDGDLNCFNDNQVKVDAGTLTYCKATSGSKGAVIVSW